jgi:hypothetical protein
LSDCHPKNNNPLIIGQRLSIAPRLFSIFEQFAPPESVILGEAGASQNQAYARFVTIWRRLNLFTQATAAIGSRCGFDEGRCGQ